jgi:hypothetical protein
MKTLLVAITSLVLVLETFAQNAGEEKQVREVVQSFYASFNSHAWTHAVDYTTEDWNHINPGAVGLAGGRPCSRNWRTCTAPF